MGINSGLLGNATPLTAEQILEVEQRALDTGKVIAYLNEKEELCFATPHSADSIKKLAWNNCSSFTKDGTLSMRRDYKRSGLETFEAKDFLIKNQYSTDWTSMTPEPLHINSINGLVPEGITIFAFDGLYSDCTIRTAGQQMPLIGPGTFIIHEAPLLQGEAIYRYAVVYKNPATLEQARLNALTAEKSCFVRGFDSVDDCGFILSLSAEDLAYHCDYENTSAFLDNLIRIYQITYEESDASQLTCAVDRIHLSKRDLNLQVASSIFDVPVTIFGWHTESSPIRVTDYLPERLILPASIDTIGDNALEWGSCAVPTTVIALHSGPLLKVGSYAFAGSAVGDFIAPFCKVTVGDWAFSETSWLQNFICPSGCTSIGDSAFTWCDQLTTVTFAPGLHTIGCDAFGHSGLQSITLPSTVTFIDAAFQDCQFLEYVDLSATQIDHLAEYMFYLDVCLREVRLPDSVISIGQSAFEDCYSLSTINMPDNLMQIENSAFYGCDSLNSLAFGAHLQGIGQSAFAYSGLTSIDLSRSPVSWIDAGAFAGTDIEVLNLSASVNTAIMENAFYDCHLLNSVTLGKIEFIDISVFENCGLLTEISVNLPVDQWQDLVTNVFADQWLYGSSIEVIHCTDGDIIIEKPNSWVLPDGSIYYNQTTGETYFGGGGTVVSRAPVDGDRLADDPAYVEYVYAEGSNGWVVDHVMNNTQRTYYIRSEINNESVTALSDNNFENCSSLEEVYMPETIKNIGSFAFAGCISLISIYIPASVESIGEKAFFGCTRLEYIDYSGTTAQWLAICPSDSGLYTASNFRGINCSDGTLNPDGSTSSTGGVHVGGGNGSN